MQKPRKYYIFLKPYGGNLGLPRQAQLLLNIIQVEKTISYSNLVKLMAFSTVFKKSKQPMERLITYYAGTLMSRGYVEILITTRGVKND
jgi:hypothetical protein|tara:strand:+ start:3039 stop:3305 length:267 start_codon:yes stop_codon:yes gene_type:complete